MLFGRIGSQNDVSDLNELFWDFFAEGVSILGKEIFVIVKKHDHHSQSAFVQGLHAGRLQYLLILFEKLEQSHKEQMVFVPHILAA